MIEPSVLVLACGALARELKSIITLNNLDLVSLECLPGDYHMRPEKIVPALKARLETLNRSTAPNYDQILIGYGDCGTGGELDRFCAEQGLDRLPGDHCYQFFAGHDQFLALHDEEPGTFYLTDYLARHFDRLVIGGLGLDRHPELLDDYFGNYRRLVYLAQVDDPALTHRAQAAAAALGLQFERRFTGYGELGDALVHLTQAGAAS